MKRPEVALSSQGIAGEAGGGGGALASVGLAQANATHDKVAMKSWAIRKARSGLHHGSKSLAEPVTHPLRRSRPESIVG
jgi:hypothetical protein